MNRPRRPANIPARRRPAHPPQAAPQGQTAPRRRSPLDIVPPHPTEKFRVLGTGADRQSIVTSAHPLEMVVIQGYTREIEDAYQKFSGRLEDFWRMCPEMLDPAMKLDEVLAGIQARQRA